MTNAELVTAETGLEPFSSGRLFTGELFLPRDSSSALKPSVTLEFVAVVAVVTLESSTETEGGVIARVIGRLSGVVPEVGKSVSRVKPDSEGELLLDLLCKPPRPVISALSAAEPLSGVSDVTSGVQLVPSSVSAVAGLVDSAAGDISGGRVSASGLESASVVAVAAAERELTENPVVASDAASYAASDAASNLVAGVSSVVEKLPAVKKSVESDVLVSMLLGPIL
jgi:hypothetical protein